MDFIEFLQNVPAPAWGLAGAMVGVVGTLCAVLLTNRSTNSRFEQQLKHEAEQKSKDRAAELRRTVYLSAVEDLVAINSFLGQLAVVDPTNPENFANGVSGFFKSSARVSLVASEGARQKVAELTGAYGRMFLDLMVDASEAHRLKIDVNVNRQGYQDLHLERMRLIAAMRDANENVESKYKFEALTNSFDGTTKQMADLSAEFSELSDMHNIAIADYGALAVRKIAKLAELQAEVSALLRQELDLEVDLEGMKAQFREQSGKAIEAGDAFLAKLKRIQEADKAQGP